MSDTAHNVSPTIPISTDMRVIQGGARNRRSFRQTPIIPDPILLGATLLLVGFSLMMLYSTTAVVAAEKFGDEFYYLKRQGVAAILGLFFSIGISYMRPDKLLKAAPYLFLAAIGCLVLVQIPGIGAAAGGAQRWIKIGPLRFQPGEFVKLSVVLYLARYFTKHEDELNRFIPGLVQPLIIAGLPCALFLLQPDFGSSAIIASACVVLALAIGVPLRFMFLAASSVVVAGGTLVAISPYRMQRVMAFMSPFSDPSGSGYQLIQSLIAVGSGGLTGVGLGGSQQKLFFLPAAHTDFLFAVVAEELGFIGASAVMGVFFILLWRGAKLALEVCEDTFTFALTIGLTSLLVVPALLNVGVVLGLLPTKGLVLPLVGYGGSSLVSSLGCVGLLQGIHRSRYS